MQLSEINPIITGSPEQAISFLREHGLLSTIDHCDLCKTIMKLSPYKRNQDNVAWRCMKTTCENYKRYFSIRRKSIFYEFRISMNKCIHLLYYWAMERSIKMAIEDISISKSLVLQFYAKIRKCCKKYFDTNKVELGGPGQIVQIDESLFRYIFLYI